MKFVTRRWLTTVSSTVFAARPKASRVSASSPSVIAKATLPALSGQTSGAPGRNAATASTTQGSGR